MLLNLKYWVNFPAHTIARQKIANYIWIHCMISHLKSAWWEKYGMEKEKEIFRLADFLGPLSRVRSSVQSVIIKKLFLPHPPLPWKGWETELHSSSCAEFIRLLGFLFYILRKYWENLQNVENLLFLHKEIGSSIAIIHVVASISI